MQEPTFLILTALAAGPQHGHGIITDVLRHEEEMPAVLLAASTPGQSSPAWRDAFDLARGGLAIRRASCSWPPSVRWPCWRCAPPLVAGRPPS
ncbi:hypothetical protein [Nonomuraea roseola]|uniref:Uncharacterized protein n=1 Tax=Nonomuraea roseola TaxID=46179 RepID=A0ABV5QDP4_9ACTN